MKKFFVIMLASVIIFAMTAPAMAMHFDINGKFRARSWVLGNYINDDDQTEYIDQRLRLTGKWGIVENVSLTFRADVLEGFWGDKFGNIGETADVDPITGDLTTTELFFETQPKAAIAFDQVYGTFVLPSTGTLVQIGRQPVNWGAKMAVAGDNRDRIKLIQAAGNVKFGLVYDKFKENFLANSINSTIEDRHAAGILAIGDLGGWKTGIILYGVRDKTATGQDTKVQNVDVYTMGAAGPVAVKAEINYVWGDIDTAGSTLDLSGIAAYVGTFFNAGMSTIGLELGYARGNDPNTADENEGSAHHDYDSPFNSIILYNADYDGFANVNSLDRGLTNALAIKASVKAKPSEKLTLTAAAIWAKQDELTSERNTNGIDDDLGFELDLIANYNIYDNVAYTLGFGYLFAGDAFGDIEDPWGLMNAVSINF
jgi:hypothetical protein